MKWLVTIKKQSGKTEVLEKLQSLGAVVAPGSPVSLGADEEVLSVDGPNNLAHLAESMQHSMKIYPNSKMSPY